MTYPAELQAHLDTGATTIARAFRLVRKDGVVFGFTDHDRDLTFDGVTFRADSGLTAKAFQQATGLAVDNTEAYGALKSDLITEADILAGRYDGAEVTGWIVNWADVGTRTIAFRGTLGEITRANGAFTAELRGMSEALNRVQGRIYHERCSAILGDAFCGFNLDQAGFSALRAVETLADAQVFTFADFDAYDDRWFEKGALRVMTGAAAGLVGVIKGDRLTGGTTRRVELWQGLGLAPAAGDLVRLEAGCDKRMETCRLKFANLLNFRGFPDMPGDDWVMSYPGGTELRDGGSRRG